MASGPASPGLPPPDLETAQAVATILEIKESLDDPNLMEFSQNNENKRKRGTEDRDNHDTTLENSSSIEYQKQKKINTQKSRHYKPSNSGPFEVVIQNKDKRDKKINPFTVGKIMKTYHTHIEYIKRSGRNLVVNCSSYKAANELLDSQFLQNYTVFVPSSRVESIGVVYAEPDVKEQEFVESCNSIYPIIHAQRLKKRINGELRETHFVKLVFDSEKLPEQISLNFVRMQVELYIQPVKQCFRCFAYGHVANSPCQRERLCRDCGDKFHSGPCSSIQKCVNCAGNHSSNSKQCPEYLRQKKIMERMSLYHEDFFEASIFYPPINKIGTLRRYPNTNRSYAQTLLKMDDRSVFPELPYKPQMHKQYSNKFAPLLQYEIDSPEISPDPSGTNTSHSNTSESRITIARANNQTQKKQMHAVNQQVTGSGPTFRPTNKIPPGTKTTPTTPNRDASLIVLIKNKINELRLKLKDEKVLNKKKVDEIIIQYIQNMNYEEIKNKGNTTKLIKNN
uniref:Pre-C2HC domain-containing protein n=1 Tax=Graphocephala atropunctata TaxID=36148 RepID=A0A1B6M3R3_9HEMI